MPSLYEIVHTNEHHGHDAYVEVRETLPGGKLAASVKRAKKRADHDFDECQHPYRCKAHRSTYDRNRKANKRAQEQLERAKRNAEAMARVGGQR